MISPLTFFDNSSIIDVNNLKNKVSPEEAENQFLALFIDKIFLKKINFAGFTEEEDDEESSMFSNEQSTMLIEQIFRQQLSRQIAESGAIDLKMEHK